MRPDDPCPPDRHDHRFRLTDLLDDAQVVLRAIRRTIEPDLRASTVDGLHARLTDDVCERLELLARALDDDWSHQVLAKHAARLDFHPRHRPSRDVFLDPPPGLRVIHGRVWRDWRMQLKADGTWCLEPTDLTEDQR